MTDMRATERLLEVIEENGRVLDMLRGDEPIRADLVTNILLAVVELRRRGDTLVRRDDLLLVAQEWIDAGSQVKKPSEVAAIERIQNALGGTL